MAASIMDASSLCEPFRFSADTMAGSQGSLDPSEELARQTRRELQAIVRDIAALCHSRVPASSFWPKYLSQVLAAMAAEGGILWHRENQRWSPIESQGVFDSRLRESIDPELPQSPHAQLILEVSSSGGAVMVPPGTPWEHPEPGNPSPWLAGLVPIPVDPDGPVEWMLEVFIAVGAGPATQRGYLRFLAQMADLGADFIRASRLRRSTAIAEALRRAAVLIEQLDQNLEQKTAIPAIAQRIVDGVAALESAERVSLVHVPSVGTPRLVAINETEKVDRSSPAVEGIVRCAVEFDGPRGIHLAQAPLPRAEGLERGGSPADKPAGSPLRLQGLVVLDSGRSWRLVVEDSGAVLRGEEQTTLWDFLAPQLARMLADPRAAAVGRFPRTRAWGAFASSSGTFRKSLTVVGVFATILIAALLPVPLVVTADGYLQPDTLYSLYAPRDGLIDEVFVVHGQRVQRGEPLVRLADPELELSIQTARGRMAILEGAAKELRSRLVELDPSQRNQVHDLQLQLDANRQEQSGLHEELEILLAQQQSLTLSSTGAGIVDAWQVETRLGGRPVRRGEILFRIVDSEGGWSVEAGVPENRLHHLLPADHLLPIASQGETRPLPATIVLTSFSEQKFFGEVESIGPVVQPSNDVAQANHLAMVKIRVTPSLLPRRQAGAPVRVGIDCGRCALGYVVCQDLIQMVQGSIGLYW